MARHTSRTAIAKNALGICEDMRDPDIGVRFLYSELAGQCRTDPERMAQVIMCLAVWVPFEAAPSTLVARAQMVTEARVDAVRWGMR